MKGKKIYTMGGLAIAFGIIQLSNIITLTPQQQQIADAIWGAIAVIIRSTMTVVPAQPPQSELIVK